MIRFHDGPADGATLDLKRCPVLLRATFEQTLCGADGFDALDQVDDEPRPDEQIAVYLLRARPTTAHVLYSKPRGGRRGAWLLTADYDYYGVQADDAVLRDNERWRAWCREQAEVLGDHVREVRP